MNIAAIATLLFFGKLNVELPEKQDCLIRNCSKEREKKSDKRHLLARLLYDFQRRYVASESSGKFRLAG